MKKILIALVVLILLIIAVPVIGLIALGFAMETNKIPGNIVIEGDKLAQTHSRAISEIITLEEDETVKFFYASGLFSFTAAGAIVTDKRIVSYEKIDGTMALDEARYENITELEAVMSGSWVDDSQIGVYTTNENYVSILLSAEEQMDKPVLRYIEKKTGLTAK